MESYSEYLKGLSTDARARYKKKVLATGLNKDPYVINDWTDSPEIIPDVHYSDMMLYMTATPSPYTREAVKVKYTLLIGSFIYEIYACRPGRVCWMGIPL